MYTRARAHALYNVHPEGVHIWVPFRAPIRAGSPKGGRATKIKESRPIMGTPLGCPYACPTGACINGVGALPTPYGPTLRGAHCRSPKGSSKKKKVVGAGVGVKVRVYRTFLNLGQNQCESKPISAVKSAIWPKSKKISKFTKSAKFRLKREVSRRIPSPKYYQI